MINLNALASILHDTTLNPNQKAQLLKLTTVDILASLGGGRYKISIAGKELIAKSSIPLQTNESYLAKLLLSNKNQTAQLSQLLKLPKLFKELSFLDQKLLFDLPKLKNLFSSKEALNSLKTTLLEELRKSPSKEHFSATSSLLLSLQTGVVTIPLLFEYYLGFLQTKKRYNKEKKRVELLFYAVFKHIGALSGVISMDEVTIQVAYEQTKGLLKSHADTLGYPLYITVKENITPLHDTTTLLDIRA